MALQLPAHLRDRVRRLTFQTRDVVGHPAKPIELLLLGFVSHVGEALQSPLDPGQWQTQPAVVVWDNALMTPDEYAELKRQLDRSEAMHHKIMAKMTDPRFDLLEAWTRKEELDQEIGRFIRRARA